MTITPKTIQIFLPGGDARGIRVAEITTRIVQVIEVPRSLLQDFLKMRESGQVALYFLFGEAEDASAKVYIGQTGDLRSRLAHHNKEKEFWERALVLISITNSLTQTHALFLEWHSLQAANKAGRYTTENGTVGTRPHTPAPLEADCREIFETGSVLLATLGFPVFDAVAAPAPSNQTSSEALFFCKGGGADGRGLYTQEGFVVLKGSVARRETQPAMSGHWYARLRDTLIESKVMLDQGGALTFDKDHLFTAPSPAAAALLGRPANGWTEWKTSDGKTLNAVKRQAPVS